MSWLQINYYCYNLKSFDLMVLKWFNFLRNLNGQRKEGDLPMTGSMCISVCNGITSWEIDGETVETVSDFIFLGSKITEDGDCSH